MILLNSNTSKIRIKTLIVLLFMGCFPYTYCDDITQLFDAIEKNDDVLVTQLLNGKKHLLLEKKDGKLPIEKLDHINKEHFNQKILKSIFEAYIRLIKKNKLNINEIKKSFPGKNEKRKKIFFTKYFHPDKVIPNPSEKVLEEETKKLANEFMKLMENKVELTQEDQTNLYNQYDSLIKENKLQELKTFFQKEHLVLFEKDSRNPNLLIMAIYYTGEKNNHFEIIKYLIDQGAHINSEWIYVDDSYDEPIAKLFTPLILAVDYNNIPVIELLISKGANLELKDNDDHTALIHAHQNPQIVELLINAGANAQNLINGYLQHQDYNNTKLVLDLALKKNPSFLKDLEDKKNSPLFNIDFYVGNHLKETTIKFLKLFIDAGANINALGKLEITVAEDLINRALKASNYEVTQLVLDLALKKNPSFLKDLEDKKNSPLFNIRFYVGGHLKETSIKFLKLFIDAGANINALGRLEITVAEDLINRALKASNYEVTQLVLDLALKKNPSFLKDLEAIGDSPLFNIDFFDSPEVGVKFLKLFIDAGADINAKNEIGTTTFQNWIHSNIKNIKDIKDILASPSSKKTTKRPLPKDPISKYNNLTKVSQLLSMLKTKLQQLLQTVTKLIEP